MTDSEFLTYLKDAVNIGVHVINNPDDNLLGISNLLPEQQVIIDSLLVIGKIGGGDLRQGIKRLETDDRYSKNIKSKNHTGWGLQDKTISTGEMLAKVLFVKSHRPEYKRLEDICFDKDNPDKGKVDFTYGVYSKYLVKTKHLEGNAMKKPLLEYYFILENKSEPEKYEQEILKFLKNYCFPVTKNILLDE